MAIRFQLYQAYVDDPLASSSHPHIRESVKALSDSLALVFRAARFTFYEGDVISKAGSVNIAKVRIFIASYYFYFFYSMYEINL